MLRKARFQGGGEGGVLKRDSAWKREMEAKDRVAKLNLMFKRVFDSSEM